MFRTRKRGERFLHILILQYIASIDESSETKTLPSNFFVGVIVSFVLLKNSGNYIKIGDRIFRKNLLTRSAHFTHK